ncbi:uncharacterized protein ASPGLDRAFT_1214770 [Aspergillus glaucus CBS 516.65]|uniref:DUF7492 domain-containing protein n=1 Tax=Aspergillus glaucus CBS 516.65 TaxID=1160497 RepID=A0A1L9VR13_ASPGL|nr:hypothetical protein ASPGLDRAFT_1214770 [Aspergillus glaucus CBS 516.65]OJJ86334.1 hypothetical protein ASPGLDRAFT_1214770 [Aspergillus glaucus CBS 516.65]
MIEGIDIADLDGEIQDHGYVRNYSLESATLHRTSLLDVTLPGQFCHGYQQLPVQSKGRPRLRASPGSILNPRCLKHGPITSRQTNTEKGVISWYGTQEQWTPDSRTFSDVLNFQQGIGGQLLAVDSPYSDGNTISTSSFTIPPHIEVGSPYTVYWMWNTTEIVDHGWLVYTSCMDIDIVESASATNKYLIPGTSTCPVPPFANTEL